MWDGHMKSVVEPGVCKIMAGPTSPDLATVTLEVAFVVTVSHDARRIDALPALLCVLSLACVDQFPAGDLANPVPSN
jgi:hypothetical protein